MDGKVVERTGEPHHVVRPWWAGLGTWGAVALIVFGGVAAAWVFLGLPGAPWEPASGYRGAGRLIAIGLVMVGCTLVSRRRRRAAAGEEAGS
ncbi:hypothetical protein [Streptomyces sp. NPDC001781]